MTTTLKLTAMAYGGAALGREDDGRVLFVPFAIPGETAEVEPTSDKKGYAHAKLQRIVAASPDRVEPFCPHFTDCPGCHWQHIAYPRQLALKTEMVEDQLGRIAGIPDAPVQPTIPHPAPLGSQNRVALSPVAGGLARYVKNVRADAPITECRLLSSQLESSLANFDLQLPALRGLELRLGAGNELMANLTTESGEPPQIEVDTPISLALALPDGSAVTLIGEPYLGQKVNGRLFRVSPDVYFYPSLAAAELTIETVLKFANLSNEETILEIGCGAGILTAFLGQQCRHLIGIEPSPNAIADCAVNLDDFDHIALYEGEAEEILPALSIAPDAAIIDLASGISQEIATELARLAPRRVIVISSELPAFARDAKQLGEHGFQLYAVQPIDAYPHATQILTIARFERRP